MLLFKLLGFHFDFHFFGWGLGNPSSIHGKGGGGGERGSCDDDHHHHLLFISEDVLIQILLWLPVISLLRFKSVCKSWRSIIESTFFIHLHATTTTTKSGGTGSSSSSSSVLINIGEQKKKGNILTLSGEEFEFFENLGIPVTLVEYLIDEEEEFELLKWCLKEFVEFFMVGCCDGIICLHDVFSRNVALWNPAIKQSRILPKPSNHLGFSKCFAKMFINDYGDDYKSVDFVRFGIDIKTNDYKVLLITTLKTSYIDDLSDDLVPPHERRVHVYSLSTDSWKCIDDATLSAAHPDLDIDIYGHHNQGLYLNGSYFFTAVYFNQDIKERRWNMSLLLSFDFTDEIFRTIQPPFDLRNKTRTGYVYFIRFGENVALIDVKEEFLGDYEYDIWVLNEQHSGMKESWTKFYTIGPPSRLPNEPLFITNNGEFAIIFVRSRQDVLRLLNLITGEKKVLQCDCEGLNWDFVQVYKPSLMPICGNGATPT